MTTTNVADDEAARLAALIGDSDSADSAAEDAEPSPRDAGRAPTPEPEADGEERAPSAFLFGELCRVRERANKSEVEAQALERKLSMAEELRSVDVARARAASSRALAEALAALRRRAARDGGGDDGADADAAAERDEAQTWDRRAEGWAYERNQRLARLEAACDDARRAWRGEPYRNGDGVARRVVAAVEACLAHRAAAGYAAFLLEVRHAASMRRLHRRGDGVASRSTPSRGRGSRGRRLQKKRRPAPRRPSPRRAPRTARPRAARARPRCGPSRAPRTRASGAGSAASAGIAPASCPSSHQYAIAATRTPSLRLGRHRRDGRAHRGRGRLALIELLNGGALAASLAALAVEEEPQLKPAEHAVAHYGAGALLADPRCAKRACNALAALEAAGVEFRLRHARAALERLDAVAPAAAPSAEPADDDDDEADSVASGVEMDSRRWREFCCPHRWRRARRASPTSARARSARCARGGRRRLAPFPTSPRIPGRRPVSTRRLVVFPRRRSCYRTIPGPRPRADPAGGRGFCLTP